MILVYPFPLVLGGVIPGQPILYAINYSTYTMEARVLKI